MLYGGTDFTHFRDAKNRVFLLIPVPLFLNFVELGAKWNLEYLSLYIHGYIRSLEKEF